VSVLYSKVANFISITFY